METQISLCFVLFLLVCRLTDGLQRPFLTPLSKRISHRRYSTMAKDTNSIGDGTGRSNSIVIFEGLKSDMFAHPADIDIRRQLSNLPFLESFARNVYKNIEQAMVVDNLGSSILVGPNQMSALHKTLMKASKILDMDPPDLYVKQNPTPNAYTLAYMGKKPFIVIHTGLLDIMDEEEILAVIGHEMGHLKCEHGVWITLLSLIFDSVSVFVGRLVPVRNLLLRWQRSAEYTGDRAALLVTQDYRPVVSVLMKLCGGSSKNTFSQDLNVDAFLEQAKQLEVEQQSLSGGAFMWANDQVATHPIPIMRATELVAWFKSAQYSGLIRRGKHTAGC
mmetsp:Transcript_10277/g.16835  ORF Transcript_10277/g.16835 Transcript_10277/m.16835 type:complete len:332 (+) Transcript_10277:106-1101(+)